MIQLNISLKKIGKFDPVAFNAAKKNKWFNRIMMDLGFTLKTIKINGWSDDELRLVAKTYQTRNDFSKNSMGAHFAARKRGLAFLDEICSHMDKIRQKWDDKLIREAALTCKNKREFQKKYPGAHTGAKKRGCKFMDEICSHMDTNKYFNRPVRLPYTDDELKIEATKYTARGEFIKKSPSLYAAGRRRGKKFMDEICSHMVKIYKTWDDKLIREAALTCKTKKEFRNTNFAAYTAATRRGKKFMDEICSHMVKSYQLSK